MDLEDKEFIFQNWFLALKNQNKRKNHNAQTYKQYTGMTKIQFGEICLRHFSTAVLYLISLKVSNLQQLNTTCSEI